MNPDTFNLLNQDQLNQLENLLSPTATSEYPVSKGLVLGYVTAFSLLNQAFTQEVLLADLLEDSAVKLNLDALMQLLNLAANQAKQGFAQDLALLPPANLSFTEQSDELADWCSGFMLAVFNNELDQAEHGLTEKQLDALPELLFPIMALSGLFDEEEEFADLVEDAELLEEFSQDLGEVLLDLYCLLHAPEEKG